jgi:uncharacterized protein involved in exopolysaccharide biosynthesis
MEIDEDIVRIWQLLRERPVFLLVALAVTAASLAAATSMPTLLGK